MSDKQVGTMNHIAFKYVEWFQFRQYFKPIYNCTPDGCSHHVNTSLSAWDTVLLSDATAGVESTQQLSVQIISSRAVYSLCLYPLEGDVALQRLTNPTNFLMQLVHLYANIGILVHHATYTYLSSYIYSNKERFTSPSQDVKMVCQGISTLSPIILVSWVLHVK